MKHLSLCLMLLILFSCSNETVLPLSEVPAQTHSMKETDTSFPSNTQNPYDSAGRVYTELFDAYFESPYVSDSLPEIISAVELLASQNPNFNRLISTNYTRISSSDVPFLMVPKNTTVYSVLSTSSLSENAKISLADFITSLVSLYEKEASSEALYEFVVAYELDLVQSKFFTSDDKTKMLVTTSIARHAAVRPKKKPKKNTDPDWDLMVGNLVAGSAGSDAGVAEAITWSLITGIAQNNPAVSF